MKRLVTVLAGVGVVLTFLPPAISAAASDTANTLFPADGANQLDTHSWVDCQPASGLCDFTVGANLRTPDGAAIGFPGDLWSRQSTTIRSSGRSTYLDVHTNGGEGHFADRGGPGTRVFKEGGSATITSLYNGAGPPENYQTSGTIQVVDLATGAPKAGADVFVCTHIQVAYGGINITSPSTCARTTLS